MKRKHTEQKSANRGLTQSPPRPKDWFKGMHQVSLNIIKLAEKRYQREREPKTPKTLQS